MAKHTRREQNKFWDSIPDDEPVFVIRGQDKFGADTVRQHAVKMQGAGSPSEKVDEALDCAVVMEAWPTKKVPD